MEVNPTKAGIREIYPDPFCPQLEPTNYNEQTVPNISKYVYLGTEISGQLDIYKILNSEYNAANPQFRC